MNCTVMLQIISSERSADHFHDRLFALYGVPQKHIPKSRALPLIIGNLQVVVILTMLHQYFIV
ncbi:hypothetical protein BT63DRAFT_425452 [Microthyrium microscopicum]|uniref:Uncharacterized protein n=1 Tax=Microthyrium microscopicum TaxID=703497 RepID=A0A6A6U7L6_9PEZI|nr:hypothetical protein BT63DRAFT_425452 [Microthyrium microscopicum]